MFPALLAAVLLGPLLGCSKSISVPRTAPVHGTVLFKDKPVAGIRVTFHPQFDIGKVKFTPTGMTDKDGKFVLTTGASGDGAPAGEYIVTFDRPQIESDRKNSGIEIEVDAWKGKHSDPASSNFKVEIHKGENALETFRIE